MASITASKTFAQTFLAHTAITHPDTVVGSEIDVGDKLAVELWLYHGYVEATADTVPGKFQIWFRPEDAATAGDENWVLKMELQARGTTPDTEAMTATEPVGETVMAVASTTGFALSDVLYIQDTGTASDSEWNYLREFVTNTSITLMHGLTRQKDSSDVIWNDASVWGPLRFDLTGIAAMKIIFTHEGATGANCHVKAVGNYLNSYSAA